MKLADRLKQKTNATNTATVTLTGTEDTYRSLTQVVADGDLAIGDDVPFCVEFGDQWELSLYTVTSVTFLTRKEVLASSEGGTPVLFTSGTKAIFCTAPAEYLNGVKLSSLAVITPTDEHSFLIMAADGKAYRATIGALRTMLGASTQAPPAGDTTKPTVTGASVANISPTVLALAVSEALNTAFTPAASAFTVGGHAVSSAAIAANGLAINLTLATPFVNGEAARTVDYVKPGTNQARDAAGNQLDSFSGQAIVNNVAAAASGPDYLLTAKDGSGNLLPYAELPANSATNPARANFNLYIKTAGNVAPADGTVKFHAVKVGDPAPTHSAGWTAGRLGGWGDTDTGNQYFALHAISGSTVYVYAAGTYKLVVTTSDGFIKTYQENGVDFTFTVG